MPVLEGGLVRPVDEAFLSSIVLDELDIELDRRGHRFCRYQDDTHPETHTATFIFVATTPPKVTTERGMACRLLADKLRLKVNEPKARWRPEEGKSLGFSIANDGSERPIAPKALDRFKVRIREIACWTREMSLQPMIATIPHLMTRVLRLPSVPARSNELRNSNRPETAFVSLAAMAERA